VTAELNLLFLTDCTAKQYESIVTVTVSIYYKYPLASTCRPSVCNTVHCGS